jgi:alginate O-acetyltransferase complex protein AlgI
MSFTSVSFLLLFFLVFLVYWSPLANSVKKQNWILLISSYIIFGFWAIDFIPLLLIFSGGNYWLGNVIYRSENAKVKRNWRLVAVLFNLTLFYFKYFGVYLESMHGFLTEIGIHISPTWFNILAPIGISYFVFRALGYVLDIYKGKTKPLEDPSHFFLYIIYFPAIIAGPIEKAQVFYIQIREKRTLSLAVLELAAIQFLWGLFKKFVIADNCSFFSDSILSTPENQPSILLLLAMLATGIQIYADFSGYCDMAEALSKFLGIRIVKNFNYPFFSQSIVEFWRRWHISLTTWLTEHVFTPLSIALRDYGKTGTMIAITCNMVICGIWHGPNLTFIFFGLLHGLFFIPPVLSGKSLASKKSKADDKFRFSSILRMFGIFALVSYTEVIFVSESLQKAFEFSYQFFWAGLLRPVEITLLTFYTVAICVFFIFIEWFGRQKEVPIFNLFPERHFIFRWSTYAFLLFIIGITMRSSLTPFVYQQF